MSSTNPASRRVFMLQVATAGVAIGAAAQAFAAFARAYADQTEVDHAALLRAVQAGRLPIDTSADEK